ncbi:Haem peroxidase,Haem peroxidase, animal type [Cinara cedri]|uniref:Haem peroxidase,Haem peroxidase, animal type n=1 Tax=Cinara cedri TaxID=506608 RepID=A0A5E4M8U3_9HEMI|nr:Haem peroxidase,Haem peroxidase, animal type [Cinara cedri]
MVNDIPLETWNKTDESTVLLSLNKNNDGHSKSVYDAYQGRILILFLAFTLLIFTFAISAVDLWSDLGSNDGDQPVQSSLHPIAIVDGHFSFETSEYLVRCAPIVRCDSGNKYRTANGTCNNLNNPIWGSSNTPFVRLVKAHYSDGISKLRVSSENNKPLPSAREIQIRLFLNKQSKIPDKNNQLLMQWGQFIAHDVSNLAVDTDGRDCCLYGPDLPSCEATIKIPVDDPVYSEYNKTCMRFTRAMTSNNYSCPLQPSTFMDDASHFIDGSQIYGSNDYIMTSLRSFTDGTLKSVTADDGQEFCPHSSEESPSGANKYFYNSGDSRINMNLGLALFHNMFMRFHNYVAFKLKSANSTLSDETLFQESRRIVGAVIQHVTYTQFLPIILGKNYTENIILVDSKYDPSVNPSTSQEFSAGAFRVLHNIVPAQQRLVDSNYTTVRVINVTDWMNRPYLLQEQSSNFDNLLRGMLYTGGRSSQHSYNYLISNFMFHPDNSVIGTDLLSYDIQRGRDTGLPPYNKMRELCGLSVAYSYDDLADVIQSDDIYKLEELYDSVNDIDFLVGALLETPEDDALVGKTSRCVIGDFFRRSRTGDRFFYDNDAEHPGKFSKDKLEVIKSISLDHVICATSLVDHLQNNSFTKIDNGWYSSMKWDCDEKYKIDFKPWEEEHCSN